MRVAGEQAACVRAVALLLARLASSPHYARFTNASVSYTPAAGGVRMGGGLAGAPPPPLQRGRLRGSGGGNPMPLPLAPQPGVVPLMASGVPMVAPGLAVAAAAPPPPPRTAPPTVARAAAARAAAEAAAATLSARRSSETEDGGEGESVAAAPTAAAAAPPPHRADRPQTTGFRHWVPPGRDGRATSCNCCGGWILAADAGAQDAGARGRVREEREEKQKTLCSFFDFSTLFGPPPFFSLMVSRFVASLFRCFAGEGGTRGRHGLFQMASVCARSRFPPLPRPTEKPRSAHAPPPPPFDSV